LVTVLRFCFKFIIPPCLILVTILKSLAEGESGMISHSLFPYLDIIFKICLSSMVGYFTNYLAITMLFKPKDRTRHGIQGLVPRNQEQIAESLGDGIADNFFDPKDLKTYIVENNVIDDSINALERYAIKNLENSQTQRLITNWILKKFQLNSPRLYYGLMQVSEINMVNYLRDKVDLKKLMKELTGIIEKNIENGTIDLQEFSKKLSSLLEENTPEISQFIYDQLNKIIERQGTIKKNMLKLAVWTFDVDQKTIEGMLFDALSSDKFRSSAYKILERGIQDFVDFLNSDKGDKRINLTYHRLIVEINERFREKGVPRVMHEINKYLEKESSWKKMEKLLKKILIFTRQSLEEFVESDRFDTFLTRSMPAVLKRIQISRIVTDKVKAFDTSELEKMVKDASGEHLAAIEVLGGILGGFAGIALFDPLLFLMILCPVFGLGFLEYFLTKYRKKSH
jgi:uncharacterized membrane protein YheB (UPF0754 family)